MSSRVPGPFVVFAGLPGVGKTAISRRVAATLGATFLRIDTIEAAIASTLAPLGESPVGYVVAGRLAADQLRAALPVVIDGVNSVDSAREGWVGLAGEHAVPVRFVEVICSDAAEHRRRVESRAAEMPGQHLPTWDEVQRRMWQPFTQARLVIDNLDAAEVHATTVVQWLLA